MPGLRQDADLERDIEPDLDFDIDFDPDPSLGSDSDADSGSDSDAHRSAGRAVECLFHADLYRSDRSAGGIPRPGA